MRTFSALFIAAAFALSANASVVIKPSISASVDAKPSISASADTKPSISASVNTKPPISAAVQTCLNSMASTSEQLGKLTDAVGSFTSASGVEGGSAIYTLEQELESRLKKAGVDCCGKASAATTQEEVDATLEIVLEFVPKIEGALSQIQAKKSQFELIQATDIIKENLKSLTMGTKTLSLCLVANTPESYLEGAKQLDNQLKNAFAAARTTYGVV